MMLESLIEDAVNCLERAASASSNIARFLSSSYEFLSSSYELVSMNLHLKRTEGKSLVSIIRELDHDFLTGLPGRRKSLQDFKDKYAGMMEDISRRGKDKAYIACLYIDADKLKAANDTYGHDFGDKLIKTIAEVIRHNTRRGDDIVYVTDENYTPIFARQGGDEFVAIGRIAKKGDGRVWAERILNTVRSIELELPRGKGVYKPSVSIGVCEVELTSSDAKEYNAMLRSAEQGRRGNGDVFLDRDGRQRVDAWLLKQYAALCSKADKALYLAKERGRGRVEMCSSL
ncbi:GGDEF domain-containing protein [archaeon]|nr:GGDEF domain-containing protein [archaeon]